MRKRNDPLKIYRTKKKKNYKFYYFIVIILFALVSLYFYFNKNNEENKNNQKTIYYLEAPNMIDKIISLAPNQKLELIVSIHKNDLSSSKAILNYLINEDGKYISGNKNIVDIKYSSKFSQPVFNLVNKQSINIKLFIENLTKDVQKIKLDVRKYNNGDISNITEINYEGDFKLEARINGKKVSEFPKSKSYNPDLICYSDNELISIKSSIIFNENINKWSISIDNIAYPNTICYVDFITIPK